MIKDNYEGFMEVGDFNVKDARIKELEDEVYKLKDLLNTIKEAHLKVMRDNCPSDEEHCGCVSSLRVEINNFREVLQKYSKGLSDDGASASVALDLAEWFTTWGEL